MTLLVKVERRSYRRLENPHRHLATQLEKLSIDLDGRSRSNVFCFIWTHFDTPIHQSCNRFSPVWERNFLDDATVMAHDEINR